MKLRVVAGFVVLGVGACTASSESRTNCDAYLDCLASTDPEVFEGELAVYGTNGRCFEDASNDHCNTACLEKLERLGERDDACEPPPQPEPEPGRTPEVDENGYVACDLIVGPTVGPGEPGPLGFPEAACNPRSSNDGEFRCCSDDPAAVGGGLPAYQRANGGPGEGTTPFFSGANNGLGTSGMCVRTSDLSAGDGLFETAAANCPVPCNPTWAPEDVVAVCGATRMCCQTREIRPEDCVLGEDGTTWRPVTGADILAGLTTWAPSSHATHQDPSGAGCATFAGTSDVSSPDFADCLEQLSVADQRGFCIAASVCPADEPGYMDACEMINAGLIPPPVPGG